MTLDENGIPALAEQRFALAQKIVAAAEAAGIPREDVYIDCLTLTASAQQEAVRETLKAVRMVKERLGVKTVLGVSNISFGLPCREQVNTSFLTLAMAHGPGSADHQSQRRGNDGGGGQLQGAVQYRQGL